MSVPKSKRGTSKLEVITKANELATHTIHICSNESCFPKRYRWCITAKIVDAAVEISRLINMANSVYVNPESEHWKADWENGKPINFDPDHFPRTQDLPLIYGETSIAYVFTKKSFLIHNRRLGSHPYIKEVDKIEAMDIDYPEDFAICDAIYKEMLKK